MFSWILSKASPWPCMAFVALILLTNSSQASFAPNKSLSSLTAFAWQCYFCLSTHFEITRARGRFCSPLLFLAWQGLTRYNLSASEISGPLIRKPTTNWRRAYQTAAFLMEWWSLVSTCSRSSIQLYCFFEGLLGEGSTQTICRWHMFKPMLSPKAEASYELNHVLLLRFAFSNHLVRASYHLGFAFS